MTLRHMLADVRLFFSFWLALLGISGVIRGEISGNAAGASCLGAIGLTSLFLIWLAARAGEKG